ncbi:hypothetical protein [Arsenophonus sp. PmNCSU2021_1]|uniref:hypothetical protein n=1 Tax=Arsenophonus sp. PmNCSU2021_1 TaxID=3118989 RepID=UPI002FF27A65
MSNVAYADFSNSRKLNQRDSTVSNGTKGHIAIFRSLLSSQWSLNETKLALWLRLLSKASYKPTTVNFGGREWYLGVGQLVTKFKILGGELRDSHNKPKSESQVRRLLEFFKSEGMLTFSGDRNGTVITITNYALYQNIAPEGKCVGLNPSSDEALECTSEIKREVIKNNPPREVKCEVKREGLKASNHKALECTSEVKREAIREGHEQEVIKQEYIITTSKDVVGEFSDENNPSLSIEKSQSKKSKPVPYQAMIDAYHEILPEMSKVTVLRDSRKIKMRTFWQKCNREYLRNHNKPFTLENWKGYLTYIANYCRWMTEDRPNGNGGYWRAKNLDYLITDKCYVSVKEDRANDRNNI